MYERRVRFYLHRHARQHLHAHIHAVCLKIALIVYIPYHVPKLWIVFLIVKDHTKHKTTIHINMGKKLRRKACLN